MNEIGVALVNMTKLKDMIYKLGVDDGWGIVDISKKKLEEALRSCVAEESNVIEVIRCKDCIHYGTDVVGHPCDEGTGYCKVTEWTHHTDDEYCAWGERKDEV